MGNLMARAFSMRISRIRYCITKGKSMGRRMVRACLISTRVNGDTKGRLMKAKLTGRAGW